MGIFELNLTMVVVFLLLAIIPSELYVFGHICGRSKPYKKALPSRCSSQLELSGTLSPISGLFYSGGGEKIHFKAQSACRYLRWVPQAKKTIRDRGSFESNPPNYSFQKYERCREKSKIQLDEL